MKSQRLSQTKPAIAPAQPQTAPTSSFPVHPLLQRQAAISNRATNRLLQSQRQGNPLRPQLPQFRGLSHELTQDLAQVGIPVQAKLAIGQPNDPYEREADLVAAQVVQQLDGVGCPFDSSKQPPSLAPLDTSPPTVQRDAVPIGAPDAATAVSGLETSIQQAQAGGQSLPNPIRTPLEQAFGADFGNVKIHTDAKADQANQSLRSLSFTHRNNIFFRQGAYNPSNQTGKTLLAHELTHVLQQTGRQLRSPSHHASNLAATTATEPSITSTPDTPQIQCGFGSKVKTALKVTGTAVAAPVVGGLALGGAAVAAPFYGVGKGIAKTHEVRSDWSAYRALSPIEKYYVKSVLQLGTKPREVNSAVKQIYKGDTRFLSGPECNALVNLTGSPEGQTWLDRSSLIGSGTATDYITTQVINGVTFPAAVINYATGGNFSDWETLPYGFRLWVATYAEIDRANMQDTPPLWKADAIESKDPNPVISGAAQGRIYARDSNAWADTLTAPGPAQQQRLQQAQAQGGAGLTIPEVIEVQERTVLATEIIRRLFVVMQYGLNYYDVQGQLQNWTEPVAVALSHGGRVNIRIPAAKKDPDRFFDWLIGNTPETAGVHSRSAGTHRLAIGEGVTGSFKEKKGFGAAITARLGTEAGDTFHFGLDLPVGGLGNVDVNGNVILPNGSYGHLYIGYKPPTAERDGGLLIGCETDKPGRTNALGHTHTAKATSAEFSTTGGAKSGKIGREKTGMMVDLAAIQNAPNALGAADPGWMQKLKQLEAEVIAGHITTQELVGVQVGLRGNLRAQAITGANVPLTTLR